MIETTRNDRFHQYNWRRYFWWRLIEHPKEYPIIAYHALEQAVSRDFKKGAGMLDELKIALRQRHRLEITNDWLMFHIANFHCMYPACDGFFPTNSNRANRSLDERAKVLIEMLQFREITNTPAQGNLLDP